MEQKMREIRAEDINPRFNWGRALPALGTMGVDFEERVDYRRLHRYRLARVKQALENSDLGALLVFDVNNIRYITSTKIGEWERDKRSEENTSELQSLAYLVCRLLLEKKQRYIAPPAKNTHDLPQDMEYSRHS